MADCRWFDVVSSESCTSFGPSALLAQERPNRFLLRSTDEQLVLSLDPESLERIKQSLSESKLAVGDSFVEYNRPCDMMNGKTGVTMDLQQKMCLGDEVQGVNGISQADIIASLYNDMYNAALDAVDEMPLKSSATTAKASTVTSFSGFLGQQDSSQESVTCSKGQSQNEKVQNSAKQKGIVKSSGSSRKATQSPMKDTEVKATVNTKAVPSNDKEVPIKTEKKAAIIETLTPTRSTGETEDPSVKKSLLKGVESAKRQKENTGPSVYFDDQTQLPLNPAKKPHIVKRTFDEQQVSRILLNQFNKTETKHKQQESQTGRLYSRLKDIAIGKSTRGYQNYIKKVPIDQRTEDDPQTPNMHENISAARFQAIYRKWRTSLHKYDHI